MGKENSSIKGRYTLTQAFSLARKKPNLALKHQYVADHNKVFLLPTSVWVILRWYQWSFGHLHMSMWTSTQFSSPFVHVLQKSYIFLVQIADWWMRALWSTQNCVSSSLFCGWSPLPLFITCWWQNDWFSPGIFLGSPCWMLEIVQQNILYSESADFSVFIWFGVLKWVSSHRLLWG